MLSDDWAASYAAKLDIHYGTAYDDVVGLRHTPIRKCVRALAAAILVSCAAHASAIGASTSATPVDTAQVIWLSCPGHGTPSLASRCVLPPPGPAAAHSDVRVPSSGQVAPLPPPPNSLALVLSALLAAGAYQGTRSLARLGATALPDWYHDGAPAQVGHVRVYDFGISLDEPVFGSALPADTLLQRVPLDKPAPPSVPFIPTRSPRSPPGAVSRA